MKLRVARKIIKLAFRDVDWNIPRLATAVQRYQKWCRIGRRACDHKHWSMDKHGRRCTCGLLMFDPGD